MFIQYWMGINPFKYLKPLWINQLKISGTHEHQGEIKDVRLNIEPYSTKRIRLLIPKNNALCDKKALFWKDEKKDPEKQGLNRSYTKPK